MLGKVVMSKNDNFNKLQHPKITKSKNDNIENDKD